MVQELLKALGNRVAGGTAKGTKITFGKKKKIEVTFTSPFPLLLFSLLFFL